MFNSVFYGGDSIAQVNAVSGGILKNHPDSFFLHFHLNSVMGEALLSPAPHRFIGEVWRKNTKQVEVLQLVIVGNMQVVAEVIDLKPPEAKKEVTT